MKIEDVAHVAHEVIRAYNVAFGNDANPPWQLAPEWQRESAMRGVRAVLMSDLTPEQLHERWLADKIVGGWRYGPVKDENEKTHPCLLPYDQLPQWQRVKDYLFRAVVMGMRDVAPVFDGELPPAEPALAEQPRVDLPEPEEGQKPPPQYVGAMGFTRGCQ